MHRPSPAWLIFPLQIHPVIAGKILNKYVAWAAGPFLPRLWGGAKIGTWEGRQC
jgi:hypothetical protein